MLFICYPNWGTCKKARAWLDKNKLTYTERNIKANNPSVEEITNWYEKSDFPLKKFFNTSGMKYRELQLTKKLPEMSEKEQIETLASDGMLLKRPILVTNDKILIGFKEEQWALFFRK